jgi:hypothetical protein
MPFTHIWSVSRARAVHNKIIFLLTVTNGWLLTKPLFSINCWHPFFLLLFILLDHFKLKSLFIIFTICSSLFYNDLIFNNAKYTQVALWNKLPIEVKSPHVRQKHGLFFVLVFDILPLTFVRLHTSFLCLCLRSQKSPLLVSPNLKQCSSSTYWVL